MRLSFSALVLASVLAPANSFSFSFIPSLRLANGQQYFPDTASSAESLVSGAKMLRVGKSPEALVRSEYINWARQFGKTPEESRYQNFRRNYFFQAEYARKRGETFTLNEFADCTEAEFYSSTAAGANTRKTSSGYEGTVYPSNGESFVPGASDDTEALIRSEYIAWVQQFGKSADEARYQIFKKNYMIQAEYANQTGKTFRLNEYADCTEEEFAQMSQGTPSVMSTSSSLDSMSSVGDVETSTATATLTAPAKTSTAYMDALSTSASGAPAGAGLTGYLDAMKPVQSSSGPGLKSYLDALPTDFDLSDSYAFTSVAPTATSAEQMVTTSPPPPPANFESMSMSSDSAAKTSASYMDALTSTSSGAPSGAGMTSYLDALRTSNSVSGPGTTSYLDTVGAGTMESAPLVPPSTLDYNPPPVQVAEPKAADASAAYYFDSGSVDDASVQAAKTSSAYMDALTMTSSGAPRGAGMAGYLDSMKSAPGVSGPGMSSYLDAMPTSLDFSDSYTPTTANVGSATQDVPATPVEQPLPETNTLADSMPSSSYTAASVSLAGVAKTSASYMDALASTGSSGAPSGAGLTSYLDALRTSSSVSGPGTTSYLDTVASGKIESVEALAVPEVESAPIAVPEVESAPIADYASPVTAEPDVSASSAAKPTSSYMDGLASSSSGAPSGTGMASYLDSMASSSATRTPGAKGMGSYLDNMSSSVASTASYTTESAPPSDSSASLTPQPMSADFAAFVSTTDDESDALPEDFAAFVSQPRELAAPSNIFSPAIATTVQRKTAPPAPRRSDDQLSDGAVWSAIAAAFIGVSALLPGSGVLNLNSRNLDTLIEPLRIKQFPAEVAEVQAPPLYFADELEKPSAPDNSVQAQTSEAPAAAENTAPVVESESKVESPAAAVQAPPAAIETATPSLQAPAPVENAAPAAQTPPPVAEIATPTIETPTSAQPADVVAATASVPQTPSAV